MNMPKYKRNRIIIKTVFQMKLPVLSIMSILPAVLSVTRQKPKRDRIFTESVAGVFQTGYVFQSGLTYACPMHSFPMIPSL